MARALGAGVLLNDSATSAIVDAAAGVRFFPKEGATHKRLREAAETGQIAYVTQGRSAKRGRAR